MLKFSTCLWFDGRAEEAARFYTKVFRRSRMGVVTRYGPAAAAASGRPEGSVMTATFEIEGQSFMALNGGPEFKFTPAISLMVLCDTQKEIDDLWRKLSKGGQIMDCGWVTDKFGVTWQIDPAVQIKMIEDKRPDRVERVMKAMMKMKKLNIKALLKAYEGPSR